MLTNHLFITSQYPVLLLPTRAISPFILSVVRYLLVTLLGTLLGTLIGTLIGTLYVVFSYNNALFKQ